MKNFLLPFITLIISGMIFTSCENDYRLFVGGFNKPGEKALAVYEFNSRNGDLKMISDADVGPNPAYFYYTEDKCIFYVLNEVMNFNGSFGGGITTFKYDKETSNFEKLNEMLLPYGGPCYISISPDSGYLFIANYPNGSVLVVKLDSDGVPETISDTILYVKDEPDISHAHMILNNPAGDKIYVTDLGLDRIMTYDFDKEEGKLIPANNGITNVPKGSGPRHFTFNEDGSKLYVINELGSLMMVFDVDDNSGLKLLQTLPTPRETYEENNYCADVHIGNSGEFLYGSNRGDNSIVTFSIGADGLLTLVGHTSCGGNWPRNFVIDPSGKFILVGNQKSNDISVFKIDSKTGLPVDTGKKVEFTGPACLKFFAVN